MGYLRLYRRRQIVPGVRLNISKSGPSLSFGPRGLHYTVGRHRRRFTAGIPGTGVYYTAYSRSHARQASRAAGGGSGSGVAGSGAAGGGVTPRPVAAGGGEPWLPTTKIIWGVLLIWLPPVGLILLILGLVQRKEPLWMARTLVRRARKNPAQAEALLQQAAQLLPNNTEVLGPMAEYYFAKQDFADASRCFEAYLELAPQDWLAQAHCAQSYLHTKEYDAAITHLVELRQNAPLAADSHASISAHLALAYLHKGDVQQGLEIAKAEALRQRVLGDGGQECLFVRAASQYLAGHHAQGIADLDRLYAMNPAYQGLSEAKGQMQGGTFRVGE